jgi:molybdopterin-guanine dinucleotide biosynthesis protein A
MQRDKAALRYHGKSQLEWAFELASRLCTAAFVSVRPDQREEETRARFPQIVDRQPGAGPIAGIAAALESHPKAAWLVLACDLPFLTESVLQRLIAERDAQRLATAFRSAHDGLPEPLCAIWEPGARAAVLAHVANGKQCPRKFLINSDVKLIDLPDPRALDNVNTAPEYEAASAALAARGARSTGARKTIRVQYFAILREQAGRNEEMLDTSAATAADLYEELRARYAFQLAPSQLKVALNAEFGDWRTPLRSGDSIVFIPPVAGG